MNETVVMIGGLAAALLIVVLYMALRERDTNRKLAMLEAGIDGMNREVFKLSKEIQRLERQMREEFARMELERRGATERPGSEEERIEALERSVEVLKEEVDAINGELRERVEKLDGKVRQVAFAADHAAPDEQKILQLHAQGLDSETIAKQLRLGKGEVELVLKFAKIHA